jgi:cell shape-determining protein MreD
MVHSALHIALHFLVPGLIAILFFKSRWKQAWLIMVLTMIVDLDHLLASPIYDPNRCSINFHPLHSYPAILLYVIMAVVPKLRLIGLGLLIHMGIDLTDCF